MTYGQVNGVGKPVARVVHGTTMLTADALQEGMDLLDGVFAAGGTTFDTAHGYGGGDCERVLGAWMERRGNREQVVILTKGCHPNKDRDRVTPSDLTSDLMDSLARLRTDYVDLYLLHRDDPSRPVDAIVATMAEHHAAGRIRAYGGSNWSVPRIEEANAYAARHGLPAFAASSPNYSLAVQLQAPVEGLPFDRRTGDGRRPRLVPPHTASGVLLVEPGRRLLLRPVRPRQTPGRTPAGRRCPPTPTARTATSPAWKRREAIGREHGVSAARVALAYIMQTGLDVYPIAASATPGEFADNAAALDLQLSPGEIDRLEMTGQE